MEKEFRDGLIDTVKQAAEGDLLSEEEALAILGICKRATDRKVAQLTEAYLINAIGGEAQ